jgi:hypothetical protein
MSNNNNLFNDANTKNLWCRDTLVQIMIKNLGRNPFLQGKGFSIRECTNGPTCKGAHNKDEIILFPNYRIWNRIDKSTFNFPDLYFQIINIINIDKIKIKICEDVKQFSQFDDYLRYETLRPTTKEPVIESLKNQKN